MNRLSIALLALACCSPCAAEGMWLPEQLPQLADELEATGLEIGAEKLSSLTEHPMNAVIDLGGCTASFVSDQGLVVTNHHCAWGSLQYNSSDERNLMEDGFLAASAAGWSFSSRLQPRKTTRKSRASIAASRATK